MEFFGTSEEYLLVSDLSNPDASLINKNHTSTLSVFWNTGEETEIFIDAVLYTIKSNQMFFLTEFHLVDLPKKSTIKLLKFNRYFYCIDNHDSEIGCKGLLFFGASHIPIISLSDENVNKFELLWKVFISELNSKDDLQIEMLQMLLKRFLILGIRIFKEQNEITELQQSKIDVIRNFNYLVEMHYKTKHTVAEYAEMLNKPAKSLTNLFACHLNKSPLQIIGDRIFTESKRILAHTDKSIKEISFELGFEDIQSFSRFFKNRQGTSPKTFRESQQ